ncbi:MAG TPA: hypothetical protein VN044_02320, partial [Verrucomicrobiae bacterium]|nr:hypothetical protein [Verrucomicrobiae bacterium]
MPLLWRLLAAGVQFLTGLLVVAASLAFVRQLHVSLSMHGAVPSRLVAQWLLLLIVLWVGCYSVPDWLKIAIYLALKRRRKKDFD